MTRKPESQGQRAPRRAEEPELHRLKGELLLARAPENPSDADACFRKAIAIARRQGAKSLELRAVMSASS